MEMPWKIRLDRCDTHVSLGLIEFFKLRWLKESKMKQ